VLDRRRTVLEPPLGGFYDTDSSCVLRARLRRDVVFLNRPLGQSPEDDLLLQVQGIVAEYERAKIMERSRRGKKHAAQSGSLNVMSGAPFGCRYVPVREGGGRARFEPVAEQQRVVQQIFSWIGRDRCTLAEVCRRLHKAGTPTAHGAWPGCGA
jgi:site-specific DNA recombinase